VPLNTIEDYERLGAHLAEIDPPFAQFAAEHGYVVHRQGRYPNRWMTQHGPLSRSIQITMEDVGPDGRRYDHFFPEIPYTVFGAVWLDEPDAQTRWSAPAVRLDRVPFSSLVRCLPLHLERFHGFLSSITEEYVRACAVGSHLWTPPDDAP
jgi:hypothetical protein